MRCADFGHIKYHERTQGHLKREAAVVAPLPSEAELSETIKLPWCCFVLLARRGEN